MTECEQCGRQLKRASTGRPRRFCGQTCRKRASRNPIPAALTSRATWTCHDRKRPIRVDGRAASTTDPSTWSTFAAVQSGEGDGIGIMLGDGLGCYDLDHVTDDEARRFIATITEPILYTERSMSGAGVHVFIQADEAPGWKRTVDGISVERYTRARFIAVTGHRFAH